VSRGQHLHEQHELVALAPEQLLDGVLPAEPALDGAELVHLAGRVEAERRVLGLRQLARALLEEPLVDLRPPVDRAEHADRALQLDAANPHWEQKLKQRRIADFGAAEDTQLDHPYPSRVDAEQIVVWLRNLYDSGGAD
jgi:hypothetical protein